MSGDDDLDAGWDDESEASAAVKPAAPVRPASASRGDHGSDLHGANLHGLNEHGADVHGSNEHGAAPESSRFNPERATLPPPMPEQEYIEKILATDDSVPPVRTRLNTLIEHDPLQYDAPDAHQRPTRPPASAAAAGDDFLDLSLDDELARRSSGPPQPVIPPPPPAPSKLSPHAAKLPPPREPDPLDDLPIDEVIDSLTPESLRPPGPGSMYPRPPASVPSKPRQPYDSTPSIEVVDLGARPVAPPPQRTAPQRPAERPAAERPAGERPAGERPRPAAAPDRKTPLGVPVLSPDARRTPQGTPAAPSSGARLGASPPPSSGAAKRPPPTLSKTPVRVAAVHAAAEAEKARASARPPPPSAAVSETKPASSLSPSRGVPGLRHSSKPNAERVSERPMDRPTRAIRTPAQVLAVGQESASEKALIKVAERFEAGDYGRALMLAEQVLELDDGAEELRHYAELCREKLRQTYLARIGTGRTILRVSVTDEKLRERSLDPRLAFLLSLLDGASTVDDVVDMSTMPPLEAVRALHELLVEGVVEVVERLRKAP